jgi:hypothetical protein
VKPTQLHSIVWASLSLETAKASSVNWAHMSRFHLKTETESSLRVWIKDRMMNHVENCNSSVMFRFSWLLFFHWCYICIIHTFIIEENSRMFPRHVVQTQCQQMSHAVTYLYSCGCRRIWKNWHMNVLTRWKVGKGAVDIMQLLLPNWIIWGSKFKRSTNIYTSIYYECIELASPQPVYIAHMS